jgi:hypothetical protein
VEKVDLLKIDEWRSLFRNEPPISAYDEIKRRNDEMKDLAARVQESEARYKTLTNIAADHFLARWRQPGYVYQRMADRLYRLQHGAAKCRQWKSVIHPDDYLHFIRRLTSKRKRGSVQPEVAMPPPASLHGRLPLAPGIALTAE